MKHVIARHHCKNIRVGHNMWKESRGIRATPAKRASPIKCIGSAIKLTKQIMSGTKRRLSNKLGVAKSRKLQFVNDRRAEIFRAGEHIRDQQLQREALMEEYDAMVAEDGARHAAWLASYNARKDAAIQSFTLLHGVAPGQTAQKRLRRERREANEAALNSPAPSRVPVPLQSGESMCNLGNVEHAITPTVLRQQVLTGFKGYIEAAEHSIDGKAALPSVGRCFVIPEKGVDKKAQGAQDKTWASQGDGMPV